MREVIIGITGASGIQYGIRILEILNKLNIKTHLIITKSAKYVLKTETKKSIKDIISLASNYYDINNIHASISSGSYYHYKKKIDMIIVPCSMNTLGKIANGISDNLITRSASVCLKENEKLILITREAPLSLIHLENMIKIKTSGGIIFPASPFFYSNPKSINDLINDLVGKILDLIDINIDTFNRWDDIKQ